MPPNKHNYTTRAHRFRFRVSPNVLRQNSKLIATKAHLVLRNTTRPTRKEKSRSWFARWCECVRCCAAWQRARDQQNRQKSIFGKGAIDFFLFVVTIFCLQNIVLLLLLSIFTTNINICACCHDQSLCWRFSPTARVRSKRNDNDSERQQTQQHTTLKKG